MDKTDDQIEDAETVVADEETLEADTTLEDTVDDSLSESSEDGLSETPTDENAGVSLMNLENVIKRHILDIERLQEQYKKQKEMYEDGFETEGEYAKKADELETMKREVRAIKDRITSQSSMVDLAQKMNATKEEIKDLRSALSDYLEEYHKTSKTNQIEIDRGDIREIISIIKLIKKSSKYRP
ncbi:MAG TPA: hypothetical protein VK338_00265 [Candidatus Nitrosocosmicus sp.]|nr:hypothetical protein [Candidatus Nitrosocosmicus sp.]